MRPRCPGGPATNPKVLVEVLSPGTEQYDRGEKLHHYQQIPSLSHVVLVAHDAAKIEVWSRGADGWDVVVSAAGESARLGAIGCELDVSAIYRDPLSG